MNYLKIDGKRYNLTDDGISPSTLDMVLVIVKDDYTFEDILSVFENIGDKIVIYDTVTNTDSEGDHVEEFVSGTFEGYTHLCFVNYDADNLTYAVKLSVPDETQNRLNELEDAVNFLLMGGE